MIGVIVTVVGVASAAAITGGVAYYKREAIKRKALGAVQDSLAEYIKESLIDSDVVRQIIENAMKESTEAVAAQMTQAMQDNVTVQMSQMAESLPDIVSEQVIQLMTAQEEKINQLMGRLAELERFEHIVKSHSSGMYAKWKKASENANGGQAAGKHAA